MSQSRWAILRSAIVQGAKKQATIGAVTADLSWLGILDARSVPVLAEFKIDEDVLELGAGMSGLAGLLISACGDPIQVVITDGNPQSIRNIERNININMSLFKNTKVEARQLLWGQENTKEMSQNRVDTVQINLENCFDFIIAADW
ncbi:hypothetical protein HK096_011326 [Nowakowskiella sp. JEL0078]|nr:hypothetical protein HK096_011326 [Nowakowskiella sp. JEL0078]